MNEETTSDECRDTVRSIKRMGFTAELSAGAICVFCRANPNEPQLPFGSGFFFMRRNIVATAKHVMAEIVETQDPVTMKNESGKGGRPVRYWPHPVDGVDLCLVELSEENLNAPQAPLYPSDFRQNKNAGFVAAGYDAAFTRRDGQPGDARITLHHVRELQAVGRQRDEDVEWILESESDWIAGGFSGGPILAQGGGVVGVIVQKIPPGSSIMSPPDSPSAKTRVRATSIAPLIRAFRSPFEEVDGSGWKSLTV